MWESDAGSVMDYTISWSFFIRASTERKVLEEHWPAINSRLGGLATVGEILKRSEEKNPFHLYATMAIAAVDDRQAILCCLEQAFNFHAFWSIAAPEKNEGGRFTSFQGTCNPTTALRFPAVTSAGFLLFPAGNGELLSGGVLMRVEPPSGA